MKRRGGIVDVRSSPLQVAGGTGGAAGARAMRPSCAPKISDGVRARDDGAWCGRSYGDLRRA